MFTKILQTRAIKTTGKNYPADIQKNAYSITQTYFKDRSQTNQSSKKQLNQDMQKVIKNFTTIQPHATPLDIKRIKKLFKLTSKDFSSHKIDSFNTKLILLKMLQRPAHLIDSTIISKTLNELGFLTRRDIFLDAVELQLIRGGTLFTKSIAEAEFLSQLSERIGYATNSKALKQLYMGLMHSPYMVAFCEGYSSAYTILDFIVLGKMSDASHASLAHVCKSHFNFGDWYSHHKFENLNDLINIKPVIENIVQQLINTLDLSIQIPHLLQIQMAKNELDLQKAIYHVDKEPILKPWDAVRRLILNNKTLFRNKNRWNEQLYMLLDNPKKAGVSFVFDNNLVCEQIKFVQWEIKQFLELNDERGAYRNHVEQKYHSLKPNDMQIRQTIIDELETALLQGCYQETCQQMQSLHQSPHPYKQLANDFLNTEECTYRLQM